MFGYDVRFLIAYMLADFNSLHELGLDAGCAVLWN
jgi:hypothetical protein